MWTETVVNRRTPESQIASRGVMFLFTEAFRSRGGIQNVGRDQVHALVGLRPAPPVSVMVLNDSPEDVANEEWRQVAARGFSGSKIRFTCASVKRATQQRPAILLLGLRGFLPLAPMLKCASPHMSIWLMVHGTDTWPRLGVVERECLRAVDRVLAISPDTARRFKEAGFRDKIGLLPNGLPHYWRLADPHPSRFESPTRLLAVARLASVEKYKGVDHTVEAVALLAKRNVNVVFDVAGAGDDLARLTALAESLGVAERVHFHGRVSDEELTQLYQDADIFVLPSGGEGFGLVFLEAMAFGKPVVAANIGGAPFVVRPQESGFLVPYGDPQALSECLHGLISDPVTACAAGLRSRAFLEDNFTYSRYASRFLATLGFVNEVNRESTAKRATG